MIKAALTKKLAFIGGGQMAEALVGGLVAAELWYWWLEGLWLEPWRLKSCLSLFPDIFAVEYEIGKLGTDWIAVRSRLKVVS